VIDIPKHVLILALVAVTLLASVDAAYAPLSTLGTGYAVTSDYHGIDVMIGSPVNATALTLDSTINRITFKWNAPNGTEGVWIDVWDLPLLTDGMGTWNNGTMATIRYAYSIHNPDSVGDWGVKVLFQGPNGKTKEGFDEVVQIKATSFNAVPEVPFGTVAILMAMLGALGVFAIKKRRIAIPSKPA